MSKTTTPQNPKTNLQRIANFYAVEIDQAEKIIKYHNSLKSSLEEFFAEALVINRYQARKGRVGTAAFIAGEIAGVTPLSPIIKPLAAITEKASQYFQEKDLKSVNILINKIGYSSLDLLLRKLCNQILEAKINEFDSAQSDKDLENLIKEDFKKTIKALTEIDLEKIESRADALTIIPDEFLSPNATKKDELRNIKNIIDKILPQILSKHKTPIKTPSNLKKRAILNSTAKAGKSLQDNLEKLSAKRQNSPRQFDLFASPFQSQLIANINQSSTNKEQSDLLKELKEQGLKSPSQVSLAAYKIEHPEASPEIRKKITTATTEVKNSVKKIASSLKTGDIEIDENSPAVQELFSNLTKIEAFIILRNYGENLITKIRELKAGFSELISVDKERKELLQNEDLTDIRIKLFQDEIVTDNIWAEILTENTPPSSTSPSPLTLNNDLNDLDLQKDTLKADDEFEITSKNNPLTPPPSPSPKIEASKSLAIAEKDLLTDVRTALGLRKKRGFFSSYVPDVLERNLKSIIEQAKKANTSVKPLKQSSKTLHLNKDLISEIAQTLKKCYPAQTYTISKLKENLEFRLNPTSNSIKDTYTNFASQQPEAMMY